jgi:hypothetical protein
MGSFTEFCLHPGKIPAKDAGVNAVGNLVVISF